MKKKRKIEKKEEKKGQTKNCRRREKDQKKNRRVRDANIKYLKKMMGLMSFLFCYTKN